MRIGGASPTIPRLPVLNFFTACWLGFLGACIGSFLNVVAYRMPLGMSVVWKPSHCPRCKHAIRARDNLPVLGWLMLQGKCRDCGQPISPRYAFVELAMGATFFALAYVELFSGAANLPGGPLVVQIGAANIVLHPHWAVIGLYAYHGALMCFLMAFALIACDGSPIPWRLSLLAAFAGIFPPIAWELLSRDPQAVNPWLLDGSTALGEHLWRALVQAMLAAGCGLLFACWASLDSQPLRNLVVALSVTALFLPTNATYLAVFFSIFIGLAIVARVARTVVQSAGGGLLLVPLWLAAILTLIGGQVAIELLR